MEILTSEAGVGNGDEGAGGAGEEELFIDNDQYPIPHSLLWSLNNRF
ncbi:hypothetical protein LC608_21160 [Nostoc sp. XA010]|nr:hypothetical protein [Nostoc sp. XA010]MCC5659439.1 hypothetical protein [Nostoc sp. XA010]